MTGHWRKTAFTSTPFKQATGISFAVYMCFDCTSGRERPLCLDCTCGSIIGSIWCRVYGINYAKSICAYMYVLKCHDRTSARALKVFVLWLHPRLLNPFPRILILTCLQSVRFCFWDIVVRVVRYQAHFKNQHLLVDVRFFRHLDSSSQRSTCSFAILLACLTSVLHRKALWEASWRIT